MYKYCIVPKCKNTTFKTPEKLFFYVPKDPKLRKKWYSIAKREDKIPPSVRTTRHCCEDHFDVKEDMENYLKFKLVGGKLKLKKGVLPHKFECQKPQEKKIDRTGLKKRHDKESFQSVLSEDVGHEDLLLQSIEVVECENQDSNIIQNSDPLNIPEEIDVLSKTIETCKKTQAVQDDSTIDSESSSIETPIKSLRRIELDGTISTVQDEKQQQLELPGTSKDVTAGTDDRECCCCRGPLESGNLPLYSHSADPQFSVYANMLRDCFHITISEGECESALICEECIDRLRDAASFKQQVMQSQSFMQNCPNTHIVTQDETYQNENYNITYELTDMLEIKTEPDDEETLTDDPEVDDTHDTEDPTDAEPPYKKQKQGSAPFDNVTKQAPSVVARRDSTNTEDERFYRDGCGCTERCYVQFPREKIIAFRSECRKLDVYCGADINHLDLFIMGAFPTSVGQRIIRFQDKAVCKNFFIYAYSITNERYDSFVNRFKGTKSEQDINDEKAIEFHCDLEPGRDPLKEETETDLD